MKNRFVFPLVMATVGTCLLVAAAFAGGAANAAPSAKAQAESVQYQVEQAYALLRPSLGLKASATRSHFESGKAVYELNKGGHHDHLVCLQCGRVEEFYDSEIEKRQAEVAQRRGFELHGHSLALYADCAKPGCPHRAAAREIETPS